MLIKNFYSVPNFSVSHERVEASILLNPKHQVYKGHFPEQPIVPGVIQVQLLRELLEQALNKKFIIKEVVSAKYLNIIIPDDKLLVVELTFKPFEDGFKLNGVIKNDERIFCKVKMIVQSEITS